MEDFYKILEVSQEATADEIKKSFRKLAKKYHPDTDVNDKTLGPKFQKINEAYSILSDDKLRKEYDEKLAKSRQGAAGRVNEKNENKKQAGGSRPAGDIKSAMENLNDQFAQFFGFNPKSNKVDDKVSGKKNNNPIDTSDVFESFFKAKKK